MYEHNCCYILFLHFISATVLHKKHFTQPTKLLQFYDWNHVHIKYLYLMSCVLLNTRLTQGPNITRPSQSQPYCCRGSLLSESPLFYFPSYTEQNLWVTICKIPCTSTDHICEPKFIIKKKQFKSIFPQIWGHKNWGICESFQCPRNHICGAEISQQKTVSILHASTIFSHPLAHDTGSCTCT